MCPLCLDYHSILHHIVLFIIKIHKKLIIHLMPPISASGCKPEVAAFGGVLIPHFSSARKKPENLHISSYFPIVV
jgi:hypothetical protein